MPTFSPGSEWAYRTLCGLTHDVSSKQYNIVTGDRHEKKCSICISIQEKINRSADNLVEINHLGNVIKVSQVLKKLKEQFGLSSTRARQEIAHARARKIKQWGGI